MQHRIQRLGEELNGVTLESDEAKHEKKRKSSLAEQGTTYFVPFRCGLPEPLPTQLLIHSGLSGFKGLVIPRTSRDGKC